MEEMVSRYVNCDREPLPCLRKGTPFLAASRSTFLPEIEKRTAHRHHWPYREAGKSYAGPAFERIGTGTKRPCYGG